MKKAVAETEAMRTLAELLAALPSDESRARVLRWSQEHFRATSHVSLPADDDRQRPAAPSGGDQADPALTLGEDVFEIPLRKREPIHCADTPDPASDDHLSVDESLFERDTIDREDLEVRAVDLEATPVAATPAGTKPAGLESLLGEFVAEFQRLALEWQVA